MYYVCRVDIFQSLEELIHDEFFVNGFQNLSFDYRMEIGFHKVEEKIDVFCVFGFKDCYEIYNVRVLELFEVHDFSVGSLSIGGVLKGIKNFLDCVFFGGLFVLDFIDDTICTFAKFF